MARLLVTDLHLVNICSLTGRSLRRRNRVTPQIIVLSLPPQPPVSRVADGAVHDDVRGIERRRVAGCVGTCLRWDDDSSITQAG